MLLVDTNVLVDVVQDDPRWAEWSISQLRAQITGAASESARRPWPTVQRRRRYQQSVALRRSRRVIPDVDVLVAAFRADHSHHETARAWLTKAQRDCSAD